MKMGYELNDGIEWTFNNDVFEKYFKKGLIYVLKTAAKSWGVYPVRYQEGRRRDYI